MISFCNFHRLFYKNLGYYCRWIIWIEFLDIRCLMGNLQCLSILLRIYQFFHQMILCWFIDRIIKMLVSIYDWINFRKFLCFIGNKNHNYFDINLNWSFLFLKLAEQQLNTCCLQMLNSLQLLHSLLVYISLNF